MKLFARAGAALLLSACVLPADVSYQQDTKTLGGALVDMVQKMASMPMMGRMMGGGGQAFKDQHYDVFVKGNKMARWGAENATIFDLDAGTITNINVSRKSYSTSTFEEMQQRMEQMQQRMNRGGQGDLSFDVKVNNTGQTQMIDGEKAKETIIVMTAKQATQQGQMVVTEDAWFVPSKPANKEVLEFHKKLAAKYAYAFSGGGGMGMAQTGKAFAEANAEAMKLDGTPVLTIVSITGVAAAAGPMAAMGGGETPSDPNAPLIKMQSTYSHFTQSGVDDSKFAIPAGFKEEKHGMGRGGPMQ